MEYLNSEDNIQCELLLSSEPAWIRKVDLEKIDIIRVWWCCDSLIFTWWIGIWIFSKWSWRRWLSIAKISITKLIWSVDKTTDEPDPSTWQQGISHVEKENDENNIGHAHQTMLWNQNGKCLGNINTADKQILLRELIKHLDKVLFYSNLVYRELLGVSPILYRYFNFVYMIQLINTIVCETGKEIADQPFIVEESLIEIRA